MGEDNPKVFGGRRSFAVLDEEDIFALARKIVEDEKHFLDPGLTMESLAEELNVHRNALSGAVNRFSGVAFPIWVGMYRVAEVERLAALPENHGCGTAKLALMSGFSNRKSFHRVYTSLRRGKPSEMLPGRKNKSVQEKLKISKVKPMKKILLTLLVSALLCAGAFAQGGVSAQSAAARAEQVVTFRFVAGNDVFYIPWGGNDAELNRLYSLVDEYREQITTGRNRKRHPSDNRSRLQSRSHNPNRPSHNPPSLRSPTVSPCARTCCTTHL